MVAKMIFVRVDDGLEEVKAHRSVEFDLSMTSRSELRSGVKWV